VAADQAVPRESTPPTTPGSQAVAAPAAAKELVVDDTQETALPNGKRKRLRQHIVVTGAAAPAPGATKRQKKPTSKPQKKQVEKKATVKKPAAKMASLTALMAAMGEAPSASAVVHKVLDKSPSLDDVPKSYVDILNYASVNIDSPQRADYKHYTDDMEDGLDDDEFGEEEADGEEEGGVQEIEEGAFEGAVVKAKGKMARTGNYTEFEDVVLIKAWEGVSMDALTNTDTSGKSLPVACHFCYQSCALARRWYLASGKYY
jgi:hypothetical protein